MKIMYTYVPVSYLCKGKNYSLDVDIFVDENLSKHITKVFNAIISGDFVVSLVFFVKDPFTIIWGDDMTAILKPSS